MFGGSALAETPLAAARAAATTAYSLTADAGSYSLTGSAAGLKRGLRVGAVAGSYALTGSTAGVAKGSKVTAAAGSYALTGGAASLVRGYPMAAAAGSYSLTGAAAGLRTARKVAGDAGNYALTGSAAGLNKGFRATAEAGTYALTGSAAGLNKGFRATAEAGTYALSGSAAVLRAGLKIAAAAPGGTFRRPRWSWRRTLGREATAWPRVARRALATWDRVWEYRPVPNNMPVLTLTKAVTDDRDFAFDFSAAPELAAGTGITIASAVMLGGTGLSLGTPAVTVAAFDGIAAGKAVAVRVYGGTDELTVGLACKATLSNGRVLVAPGRMVVTEDYPA